MALALEMAGGVRLEPGSLPAGRADGVYVHVPFCFHKCHYCDFYSISRQTPERMAAFVDRVLAEARQWVAVRGREEAARTVFFGGGTPSLLVFPEMGRLIRGLRDVLGLDAVDEWTVECNPATVDRAYLEQLREAGVNRVSFGAQSFDKADLKMLERHHEPDDVPRGIEAAWAAGITRVNLDLIFGVPGQTLEGWDRSLRAGIACGTKHVSAYLLTYEENTPMAVKKRLGQFTPAAEELEIEMLRHTRKVLGAAGIEPYEISNYAAGGEGGGEACRHNLMYWRGGNYLGLGPSAASHVEGWRWKNRPHLGEWERAVDSGVVGAVATEVEQLPPDRREAELGYLMIRLREGIVWDTFRAKTGTDGRARFASALEKLRPAGVVVVDEVGMRLTERGVELADAVGAELLA